MQLLHGRSAVQRVRTVHVVDACPKLAQGHAHCLKQLCNLLLRGVSPCRDSYNSVVNSCTCFKAVTARFPLTNIEGPPGMFRSVTVCFCPVATGTCDQLALLSDDDDRRIDETDRLGMS